MKILINILVLIVGIGFTKAQAPDFTQTDIYGNTYNLYDQLDLGKVVLIDFYGVGWPTCMTNAAPLDTIFQNYQAQLFMYGIEAAGQDSAAIEQFKIDHGPISYPMFSTEINDSVVNLYNVYGTPKYYVVCPDKTYRSVNFNQITDMIDTCLANIVSINNIKHSEISIYSNSNKITVINNLDKNISCDIYNITGKKVYSKEITDKNSSFYVNFTKGIYIIKLYSNNKAIKTQKIVIQ